MKVVLDSHYAPSIAWWVLANKSETILIEQHSFLQKGSYRNRCHIYGANGLLRLSIPLQRGNRKRTTIGNAKISYDHEWQRLHWESFCAAYRSSPYFEFYESDFESFYTEKEESLFEFNLKLIQKIASLLDITIQFELTDAYKDKYEDCLDTRELIHPNEKKDEVSSSINFKTYHQVFEEKEGFIKNLSILDLLFNLGPAAKMYLDELV